MRAGKAAASGGTFVLALACLTVCLDFITYGVVVPVVPVFARDMGIRDFSLGILYSGYAGTGLIAAVPMGMLSDRLGRKALIVFGMFGTALACVIYSTATGFGMLLAARMLDGLTAAATWSAGLALVGDRFSESEMGLKMGYVLASSAVGGIAGPFLGGLLYEAAGYAAPFQVMAVACVFGGIAALFLREKGLRHRSIMISATQMLGHVLKRKALLLSCFITMITTVGLGLIEPTMPVYLSEKFEMTGGEIGVLFGITMFTYALGSPMAGQLSDRFGRKKPILAGLVLTASIVPLLALLDSRYLLYLIMALLGGTFALIQAPSIPLITDNLKREDVNSPNTYGTAFGLFNLFWSTGYSVGPLLGGAVTGRLGLFASLMLYSALLSMLMVTVMVVLRGNTQGKDNVLPA